MQLILLVLACTPGAAVPSDSSTHNLSPGVVATSDDTDTNDDIAQTTPSPDEVSSETVTISDCPLVDPVVFESAEDVTAAWMVSFPAIVMVTMAESMTYTYADQVSRRGCPTLTDDGNGSFTIIGDCTDLNGGVWTGSLSVVQTPETVSSTYVGFSVQNPYDRTFYAGDGSWTMTSAGEAWSVEMDFSYRMSMANLFGDDTYDGSFVYELTAASDATQDFYVGRVSVADSAYGVTGDFCVDGTFTHLDECPLQSVGTLSLTGANEAIISDTTDDTCDACTLMTVDGETVSDSCN